MYLFVCVCVSVCLCVMWAACPFLSINHILAALIAVNGVWEEWSPWSLCSSTCGRGERERTRTCKPPQFGGEPCTGPEKQKKFCNIAVCPGDHPHTNTSHQRTLAALSSHTRLCVDLWCCGDTLSFSWLKTEIKGLVKYKKLDFNT